MTQSGRIFTASELPVRSKDPKGKAKVDVGESDKAGLNDGIPVERIAEGGSDFNKKGISAEEAIEFLRIIQQSEFKVIEQLNKTLVIISLLGLLMNSEPHRALLVKILNKAHVAQEISVEGFGGIINNISTNNYRTFTDEEILVEGRGQIKPYTYLSSVWTTSWPKCLLKMALPLTSCPRLLWTNYLSTHRT